MVHFGLFGCKIIVTIFLNELKRRVALEHVHVFDQISLSNAVANVTHTSEIISSGSEVNGSETIERKFF